MWGSAGGRPLYRVVQEGGGRDGPAGRRPSGSGYSAGSRPLARYWHTTRTEKLWKKSERKYLVSGLRQKNKQLNSQSKITLGYLQKQPKSPQGEYISLIQHRTISELQSMTCSRKYIMEWTGKRNNQKPFINRFRRRVDWKRQQTITTTTKSLKLHHTNTKKGRTTS